jgi:hypothetical protein
MTFVTILCSSPPLVRPQPFAFSPLTCCILYTYNMLLMGLERLPLRPDRSTSPKTCGAKSAPLHHPLIDVPHRRSLIEMEVCVLDLNY